MHDVMMNESLKRFVLNLGMEKGLFLMGLHSIALYFNALIFSENQI